MPIPMPIPIPIPIPMRIRMTEVGPRISEPELGLRNRTSDSDIGFG
jgi:hypothetical protein